MRGQLNHGPNADRTRTNTPKVTRKASRFSPEVRERVTRMVHEHEQGVLVAKLGARGRDVGASVLARVCECPRRSAIV